MRLALAFLVACGTPIDVAPVDAADETPAEDASRSDAVEIPDAHEAAAQDDASMAPACSKHLTVLFAVGTGAGSLSSHATSGCWSVLDADGSANKMWRKCSTSNFMVQNASAPNYAFDDTNPNNSVSAQQNFLSQCASGATGDGFEFMAYRGSWLLLFPATHLRAFFAELYASDDDIDDYWPSAYVNNAQLSKHTVYPMINIGPRAVTSPANKIKSDSIAICKTIANNGYFGVYVGTWDQPMPKTDARILALADALDACTKK